MEWSLRVSCSGINNAIYNILHVFFYLFAYFFIVLLISNNNYNYIDVGLRSGTEEVKYKYSLFCCCYFRVLNF